MLVQLLENRYPELTALQIEHMLWNTEYDSLKDESVRDFFDYIIDTMRVFTKDATRDFNIWYIFCHGGIFDSSDIKDTFVEKIRNEYGNKIKILRFSDIINCTSDQVVTTWLADIATELLMVKKDPLVRILRYVLYNYE